MRLKSTLTPRQIGYRLHQIILDMQAADERLLSRIEFDTITTEEMRALAASLLTGDTQYVRTTGETLEQAALAPDWGSWIEGQPLTTAVLSNRAVLLDLLPVAPEDFPSVYRCTVGQFIAIVKWFRRNNKRIHINLRDLDPDVPQTFDAYANQTESIGLILQELEDNSLFYCLAVRRNILFSLADQNRPHDRLRLKRYHGSEQQRIEEYFPRLEEAYRNAQSSSSAPAAQRMRLSGAAVRGGHLIHPRQFAWRLAYYQAYRDIFSDIQENEIDALLRLSDPRAEELAELARLVTLYHHRFTAPITGAFGGTYNMRLSEYAPMLDDITASTVQDRIHGVQNHKAVTDAEAEIWEWVATENVRKEDRRLTSNVSTVWSMIQRQADVKDETIDYILNQAKPITDDIQAYRDDLISAVRSSMLEQSRVKADDLSTARAYAEALDQYDTSLILGEMETAVKKVNNIGSRVASQVLIGFGAGFGVPGLGGMLAGAATFGVSVEGLSALFGEIGKEPTQNSLSGLFSRAIGKTSARMQIVGVLDDISRRQPVRRG
ncbi:MAG TPA: hypothetical protein VIG90_08635 [Pedomonas sp.]|uniref:hypothetical protein n=1 Tax=Pedomonas sp. TaxID=2976421 RepID=UPI002F40768E